MKWELCLLCLSVFANLIIGVRYALLRRAIRQYSLNVIELARRDGRPPLRLVALERRRPDRVN